MNVIAGTGYHSHAVPSSPNEVVRMRDGAHRGTDVYQDESGMFHFVSLDSDTHDTARRCVLVQLTDVSVEELSEPYGCDLDSPDGLALVGLDPDEDVIGEILWDSSVQYALAPADDPGDLFAAGYDESICDGS